MICQRCGSRLINHDVCIKCGELINPSFVPYKKINVVKPKTIDEKRVLKLKRLGLSYREISIELDCSLNNVIDAYKRAARLITENRHPGPAAA
jgi:ribosomal protein L32